MKMWSSQLWLRFKQSQSKPEKCFWGFKGIRTHGFDELRWSHIHFIRLSTVHIIFICFIPFTSTMNAIDWPAPNVLVFIAQLVEHCSANAEVMGSNPVEAPKTFFGRTLRLLKSQSQLLWSHLHFIRMSAVHIIFIKKRSKFVNARKRSTPTIWQLRFRKIGKKLSSYDK